MMHREEVGANPRRPWLDRLPLLVAAAIICLITGWNLVRLVSAAAPRNPWEAAEVVEAYRSLSGLPVYESAPEGHATLMYGAFVPPVQAELFRLLGPNNVSGRALSLASALLTVTLIAIMMRWGPSAWYLVISWALLLGVNHRSGQYFAENRPDMPAILCATRTSPASRRWPTPTPSRAEPTSSHHAAAPTSRRNPSRPDQWR